MHADATGVIGAGFEGIAYTPPNCEFCGCETFAGMPVWMPMVAGIDRTPCRGMFTFSLCTHGNPSGDAGPYTKLEALGIPPGGGHAASSSPIHSGHAPPSRLFAIRTAKAEGLSSDTGG